MKFIRYLSFDLRQGILRRKTLLLTPTVIGAVAFLDFAGKVHRFLMNGMMKGAVSYGDYWFYLYGGMHKYIPSPGNAFRFPVVWIVLFLAIPFILLNYPFEDMHGVGQQILVRSGRRRAWWLSKCCWNFLGTVLYHLILQAVGLVLFFIFQMEVSNRIHMDFITLAFEVGHQEVWEPSVLPPAVFLLPVFVSAVINMMQMTFSLFIKPMFSFFTAAVLLLASAYLLSPLLIGNYAMAFRYHWMLKEGVSISTGGAVCAVLLLLIVILGLVRFRFYDIYGSE